MQPDPKSYQGVLDSDVSMSANSFGTPLEFDITPKILRYCTFKVKWTGANATDAKMKLQVSTDNVDWDDYEDSELPLDAPAGFHHWDVDVRAIPHFRLAYSKGSNTAGTFSTSYAREPLE